MTMSDARRIHELKDLGSCRPAPIDILRLYRQAFSEYGTRALWNWRQIEQPAITQALAVADSLRSEGNLQARWLAVQIEQACCAAL